MDRLTRHDWGEEQLLYACDNCIRGLGVDYPPCATCDHENDALEKLAAYEDCAPLEQVQEWVKAIKFVNEHKPGWLYFSDVFEGAQEVFFEDLILTQSGKIYGRVRDEDDDARRFEMRDVGVSVFFTREEAQAALEGQI